MNAQEIAARTVLALRALLWVVLFGVPALWLLARGYEAVRREYHARLLGPRPSRWGLYR